MEIELYVRQCGHCDKTFETYNRIKIYCKRTCKEGNRRKLQRNHWSIKDRPRLKRAIMERDGYWCGLCKQSIDPELKYPDMQSLSIDHIIPRKHGGGNGLKNLQPTHLRCNIAKGAN